MNRRSPRADQPLGRLRAAAAAGLLALAAVPSSARTAATEKLEIGACTYTFQYDPAEHSAEDVRRFARFSAHSPEWKQIAFDQAKPIRELKAARATVPPKLGRALDCYIDELSFYEELESRKREFIRTGRLAALRKPLFGLEPRAICPGALEAAARAKTPQERAHVAVLRWGGSIDREFRKHLCDGTKLWEAFLKDADIQETASDCEGFPDD